MSLAPNCPFLDDLEIGQSVAPLLRGPLLEPHLMRWSASIENWHRIHYDQKYSLDHEGLPGLLINGSWKQHFILQMLRQWAGDSSWVWKVDFQFRAMNIVGETLTAWGRVTALREVGEFGLVDLDTGITNEAGLESTPGTARVIVPRRNGPALPLQRESLIEAIAETLNQTDTEAANVRL
jgi:acyl dehydratase